VNPEIAQMIESGLVEAVKILGPALITYFAASSQFKVRLQELERSNDFKSREHLFTYYEKRQDRLDESYHAISEGIGMVLGMSASAGAEPSADTLHGIESFAVLLHTYIAIVPTDVEIVLRDLARKKLSEGEEYRQLNSKKSMITELAPGATKEQLRLCAVSLLTVYASLERCNQLLLEKKIESMFNPAGT